MALDHASSGQIVNVGPLGAALGGARTTALVKGAQLEVMRLVLPAGKSVPEHHVAGEITVHCIEGQVEFAIRGAVQRMRAGDWLHLRPREPHALHALADSSLLVTLCLAAAP